MTAEKGGALKPISLIMLEFSAGVERFKRDTEVHY